MSTELISLRNLVHERTGLFFRDEWGLETLAARLKPLAEENGCRTFSEYHGVLNDDMKTAAGEWLSVAAVLTKQASNFYRHTERAQILADLVLPGLVSNDHGKKLKIWSAGCSTGEEPLSIAIALSEAGLFDRAQIELCASDASAVAVEKARRGVYSERRMEAFSTGLREKYFKAVSDGWQVGPELDGKIQWSVANLVNENEVSGFAGADIIFCRNVFIYFSDAAIDRTLRSFGKNMPAGGYLFSDQGDHFISIVTGTGLFEEQKIDGISIWRRRLG